MPPRRASSPKKLARPTRRRRSAVAGKRRPSPRIPQNPKSKIQNRYVMVGGFLGAGKTTALSQLARHLVSLNQRVGLITNDQGNGLVDTALLASRGFPVEEIPGGCFCCRFNSLVDAAAKLTRRSRPDVFLAEPVGSCTDLVATVSYPLRRIYGDQFVLSPLSVLVDPVRAQRVLGLAHGGRFSDKVRYIYRKQLEEADLIVINKCDLLDGDALAQLETALQREFPAARVLRISARHGTGLSEWFHALTTETQKSRLAMQVDYEMYAEGEALLGWLNATIALRSRQPIDGNKLLRLLASAVQSRLRRQRAEVAHLKLTLDVAGGLGDLAVVNLVRNDFVPELSQELQQPFRAAEVILNLRAEASPELLEAAVRHGLKSVCGPMQVRATVSHLERFRPGKPQPTHRFES